MYEIYRIESVGPETEGSKVIQRILRVLTNEAI
jgi:hypothetical protein